LKWILRRILIPALAALAIVITVIIISPARKYLLKLLTRKAEGKGEKVSVDFYQKMIRILQKKGIKKSSHLTPLEFAQQIAILNSQAYSAAHQLTIAYYKCRYGNAEIKDSQRKTINSLLEYLKESDFPRSNK